MVSAKVVGTADANGLHSSIPLPVLSASRIFAEVSRWFTNSVARDRPKIYRIGVKNARRPQRVASSGGSDRVCKSYRVLV